MTPSNWSGEVRRWEKKTVFSQADRAALGNNGGWILNIDGATPGQIYAYIDEEALVDICEQLARRADTRDVMGPHREGRAVDCVMFTTSLREMLAGKTLPFDHEGEIDAWVAELESLAQGLRVFKARRRQEASSIFCEHCLHSLLDHERPDSSDLGCQHQDCGCRGFFPLEWKKCS
jgi:hypothetical protein